MPMADREGPPARQAHLPRSNRMTDPVLYNEMTWPDQSFGDEDVANTQRAHRLPESSPRNLDPNHSLQSHRAALKSFKG